MPPVTGPDTNRALNDVLVILDRSLPMYLSDATPWVSNNHAEARQVLDRMVADYRQHVARLTTLLDARRYTINRGEFPMDFTSLHDVSLGYLVTHLVERERRDTQMIEQRLGQLTGDREGQTLVKEVLASAQKHRQLLEGLTRQPAGAAVER